MYFRASIQGERLKRLQDTINNIADALENGENTLLDKIDSKAQVETLMSMLRTGRRNRISETMSGMSYDERTQEEGKPFTNDDVKYAEYPLTKVHENIVSGYLRAAEGKTGYKQIANVPLPNGNNIKSGLPRVAGVSASVVGEVESGTVVTLATGTAGATIYYTTDGTDPTTASSSGTSVTISADTKFTYKVKMYLF